jgi:hypothetical protein
MTKFWLAGYIISKHKLRNHLRNCGCLGCQLHHVGHVYAYLFVGMFSVFENAFRTSAGTCPTAGSFAASQLLPWVAEP